MSHYKWSQTAASNASADGTISIPEGMAPSGVNDAMRAMMAASAKWRDDISGSLTTGGTSTAYTITSNQTFASLSEMDGERLAFVVHTTNGASPTLNVDGLGAKAIVNASGAAVGTGVLRTNTVHNVVYNNASSEWRLMGSYTQTGHFHVHRNDVDQSGMTPSASNKVQFTTEDVDSANWFDNATNYRYTPQEAGWYFIYLSVSVAAATFAETPQAIISKNGTGVRLSFYATNVTSHSGGLMVSSLVQLNGSTDYVEGYAFLPAGCSTIEGDQRSTFMGGWKVG